MPDPIAVDPSCLQTAGLPRHMVRYFTRLADRTAEGMLVINPAHAFYVASKALFDGCAGPVPTDAAVTAAQALQPQPAPTRDGFPLWTGYDGSQRWAELHAELQPSAATVAAVIARTCLACQPHARALLAARPPDFTSLDAYRRWSVTFHNAVSESIGSPLLTYAQAAARWGWET